MNELMLVQINPLNLMGSFLFSIILAWLLARRTQGNIIVKDLFSLFVCSFFLGLALGIPVFISLGLGLFSLVVYSFKISKY